MTERYGRTYAGSDGNFLDGRSDGGSEGGPELRLAMGIVLGRSDHRMARLRAGSLM